MSHADRLSAFLRRYELRVDAISDIIDDSEIQLAVTEDADGFSAVFAVAGIGDALLDRNVVFGGRVSFGGARNPLLMALDSPVEDTTSKNKSLALILTVLVEEWRLGRCGSAVTVELLSEAVVIQLMRKALSDGASKPGLLLGLSHPSLHRALVAIHEMPRQKWRVSDLAEVAGMSRSAFMALFSSTMGCPPATYLTHWRLAEARRHSEKGLTVKQAAREVGFGSAEALSRAHGRVFGTSLGSLKHRGTGGDRSAAAAPDVQGTSPLISLDARDPGG
jgi:AraC-like DNA-binding protein